MSDLEVTLLEIANSGSESILDNFPELFCPVDETAVFEENSGMGNGIDFQNSRLGRWKRNFLVLKIFLRNYRRFPKRFEKFEGEGIGEWCCAQRRRQDSLSAEQVACLDSLRFKWKLRDSNWDRNFKLLRKFKFRKKSFPKIAETFQGANLGAWCKRQRRAKYQLPKGRRRKLDSLQFDWKTHTMKSQNRWVSNFELLQKFLIEKQRFPQQGEKYEQIFLGGWCANMRSGVSRVSSKQRKLLDSIGFRWKVRHENWEQRYLALRKFKAEMKRFPTRSETFNGLNLGAWCWTQRDRKQLLSDDRVSLLDAIGFCWEPHAGNWEERFALLLKFLEANGRFPNRVEKLDDVYIGVWCAMQRSRIGEMPSDRLDMLKSIGFLSPG